MLTRKGTLAAGCFVVLFLLCACVNAEVESTAPPDSGEVNTHEENDVVVEEEVLEDVTITFMNIRDTQINEWIKPYVEAQFEHITVKSVEAHPGNDMEEYIGAQSLPDVIHYSNMGAPDQVDPSLELGVYTDFLEYVEEFPNFHPDRFQPGLANEILAKTTQFEQTDEEKFGILPLDMNIHALYYREDLFDRFGVNYPTSDMTWDDMLELGAQLAREEDGVNYYGFYTRARHQFDQIGAQAQDENGNLQITQDPKFERLVSWFHTYYSIPGNYPHGEEIESMDLFMDGQLALYAGGLNEPFFDAERTVNVEAVKVTTLPQWPEVPGIGPTVQRAGLAANRNSEHLPEVLNVLNYLVSDEYQQAYTSRFAPSSLVDSEINAHFASDSDLFPANLNIDMDRFFDLEPQSVDSLQFTLDGPRLLQADYQLNDMILYEHYEAGLDVGEVLRIAEDEARAALAELGGGN